MRKIGYFFLMAGLLILFSGTANALQPVAGEEALFTTSTSPDALIVLDLSGSMSSNPAGGSYKYGSSESCTADTTNCVTGSSAVTCGGGFCVSAKSGCNIDCSRLAIAKRAIFNILDDNKDGVVNSSDEGSLGVRMGYMRFYNCGTASQEQVETYSYTSGCNTLIRPIDSKYSLTYCANNSSCTMTSGASASTCVSGENASGGTPIASPLHEAKLYLDAHKAADRAGACRQKFVILMTDGGDTLACGGNGSESQADMYKRRRESVAKAKALADAGYKVFVVGIGSPLSASLQNTLNWMAYFGGTDNPNVTNSGSIAAYDPAALTSCGTSATTGTCDGTSDNCFATSNDPGNTTLSGYAYLVTNWDELALAMKTTIGIVREATYSFSQASIQSSRTQDENFLYEGSFQPITNDPFWLGHMKKYQINDDGTVGVVIWDAGNLLQSRDAATRTMKTYTGGSFIDFNTTNITPAVLGIPDISGSPDTTTRDAVVGYFRGDPNPDNWKLGDVFRSTPITVGTPSAFFDDLRDANNAFSTHRTNHVRSSANGYRLIVSGANDGQFHAFKTSDGSEAWSFTPPNLLSKLKNIYHTAHPTSLTHQYFVDGPVTVADVWLGDGEGTSKNATDWKTILVFGEGRGSTDRLWSSSSSCDAGLTGIYNAGNPYYCAYYALDITDSLNPSYLWHISPSASQGPYLGDSWSKMMTGRVRITVGGVEKEKWVGFIGGGYNGGNCSGGGACDTRGKGLFVIDLTNGSVLWSYTLADNVAMKYSMPAQPAIVDTDNDSFVDTVYLGDNGGNMWRFKLCRASEMPFGCGTANWSGGLFFDSSTGNIRPIYTGAAVAIDTSQNLWVYWGTGDKTDPTASNAQEHFYGVKDNDRTSTYRVNDIDNITALSQTYTPQSTSAGYRILMNGMGEKILADPTVFGGVVYFTTFTPPTGGDPCEQGGEASLYALTYTTGSGIMSGGLVRSMSIGTGIPSAPVLSLAPGSGGTPDLYVTVSGGSGTGSSTFRVNMTPPGVSNRNNMLYWHDLRVR